MPEREPLRETVTRSALSNKVFQLRSSAGRAVRCCEDANAPEMLTKLTHRVHLSEDSHWTANDNLR